MVQIFRSSQSGAAVAVGPLEGKVLELLWSEGPRLRVPEVHRRLCEQGHSISYSAIKAVLNNLAGKGWLIKGKRGKVTDFEVTLSREEFQERITSSVISSLKRNFGEPVIAQFVDQFAADAESLAQLERLILEKKKELGE